MDLRRAKFFNLRRHRALAFHQLINTATVFDGVRNIFNRTSVQPDVIGQVGGTKLAIAFTIRTMTRRADRELRCRCCRHTSIVFQASQ